MASFRNVDTNTFCRKTMSNVPTTTYHSEFSAKKTQKLLLHEQVLFGLA